MGVIQGDQATFIILSNACVGQSAGVIAHAVFAGFEAACEKKDHHELLKKPSVGGFVMVRGDSAVPYFSSWIACPDFTLRDIASHHATSTDDRTVSDVDAFQDKRSCAYETIVVDDDTSQSTAEVRAIGIMIGGENGDVCGN